MDERGQASLEADWRTTRNQSPANEKSALEAGYMLHTLYSDSVRKYLKTVAVVDDQAFSRPSSVPVATETLKPPLNVDDAFETQDNTGAVETYTYSDHSPTDASLTISDDHHLDGPELTKEFAKVGILCSVIEPDSKMNDVEITESIHRLGSIADVIILDWELRTGDYTLAANAIKAIFESDLPSGSRLRLIAIYTAKPTETVRQQLLDPQLGLKLTHLADEHLPTFHRDYARVVVFSKKTISAAGTPIGSLPAAIIDAHARLCAGLLPAAAISAVAAIRDNTHRLIGRFPNSLDGAFLTHRCLIEVPEEAELYFVDLFTDALRNILLQADVSSCLSAEMCVHWLKASLSHDDERLNVVETALTSNSETKIRDLKQIVKPPTAIVPGRLDSFFKKITGTSDTQKSFEKLQELLKDGNIKVALIGKEPKPIDVSRELLSLLYQNNLSRAEEASEEMTILSDFAQLPDDYFATEDLPRLHLGAVLAIEVAGEQRFLLCVQPHCDSVRLDEVCKFPFLDLKPVSDLEKYDLCLPWMGGYKHVRIERKPNNLHIEEFARQNAAKRYVEGHKDTNNVPITYTFEAIDNKMFQWIGELRIGKAQRLSSQLASRLHTLGIDEYEYSRMRGSP